VHLSSVSSTLVRCEDAFDLGTGRWAARSLCHFCPHSRAKELLFPRSCGPFPNDEAPVASVNRPTAVRSREKANMTKNLPVVYQPPAPEPEPDWRSRQRATKFNDAAKELFLKHYRQTFRLYDSAHYAGVSCQTVLTHKKKDPVFAAAMEEARYIYADMVEKTMHKVAIEGTIKTTYDKQGNVVSEEIIYATNILAMMAKRANPEYKEAAGAGVELNVNSGGVLVVPERHRNLEEAEKDVLAFNADHAKEPGT
jgi:hypothetical protein